MTIAVRERTSEIGLLRAVGMGRRIRETRNRRVPLPGPDALHSTSVEIDDTGEIVLISGSDDGGIPDAG